MSDTETPDKTLDLQLVDEFDALPVEHDLVGADDFFAAKSIASQALNHLTHIMGLLDLTDDSKGAEQISGSDFIEELCSYCTDVGLLKPKPPPHPYDETLGAYDMTLTGERPGGWMVVTDDYPDPVSGPHTIDPHLWEFMLVERNVRGSNPPHWVTFHDSAEKARAYLIGQEYPDDWDVVELVDRSGKLWNVSDTYERVRTVTVEPNT